MPGPPFFAPVYFTSEIVFTLLAVLSCLIIYLRTRESYELTKHEGLRYFRDAFLFFGLSYTLRFLFGLLVFSKLFLEIYPRIGKSYPIFIFLLGYLSTAAIFYLVYSAIWKIFNRKKMLIVGHSTAIVLSALAFATSSEAILLYLQAALLIFLIAYLVFSSKNNRKISQMKVLYFLVSALWLINLWVIDRRRPLPGEIEIATQALSIIVFVIIYYRVSKWTR